MSESGVPGEDAYRDFMLYVLATRELVGMVENAAHFTVHVSGTMRGTWERAGAEELAEYDSGSIASMARTASNEIAADFPLLHGHTLVGLWGALEACIDDICVTWLSTLPSVAVAECLSGLKVPLSDFLSREGSDRRRRWVISQVESGNGSALKKGVGQFETVLDRIGLDGPVAGEVRDTLFITKALRNLYAHRAGRADAKFMLECREFGARDGEQVAITRMQLTAAYTAMVLYVETILDRVRLNRDAEPRGLELPPWIENLAALRTMIGPVAPLNFTEDGTD